MAMTLDRARGCYVPKLFKGLCTQCGACYDVCPGHGVDFEQLEQTCLGDIPQDITVGRHLACYVGHATDQDVRYNGASGGMVTALLVFALEKGYIDGALVTRMRPDKPLESEPFFATTPEEILSAAGSKYCPVPVNVGLKELLEKRGRFAVVGLPCHMHGIRKAEQRLPKLAERIRYRISLTCSLNYGLAGIEAVLRDMDITPESVETLQYRGRGWPGSMSITLKDGTERTVPLAEYYTRLKPFALRRCTLCSDMFGELSDLSCGDAWPPAVGETNGPGSSFVISRTTEAEELLENAAASEAVLLSELALPKLVASQGCATFKKRTLKARMTLFRMIGRNVPQYRQQLIDPIRGDYASMARLYIGCILLRSNSRILRRLAHLTRVLRRRISRRSQQSRAGFDGHAQ